MARYRVMQPSFINNVYHAEGDEVEYDGPVSENLEPLEKPKAAKTKDETPLA